MLATDYPFLSILWTMLIFFAWVIWFWLLITVFADLFRRRDLGGGGKTLWIIFVIILPFLGVFIYLISQGTEMTERNVQMAEAQQERAYQSMAASQGDPAAQIARAKGLLDSGAISQAEFDALKAKALA